MDYVVEARKFSPSEKAASKICFICHDAEGKTINPPDRDKMIGCVIDLVKKDGQMTSEGDEMKIAFPGGVYVTAICPERKCGS